MLCQNCGRRSSDQRSFCSHCGAIASPDLPESQTGASIYRRSARREAQPMRPSTFRAARPAKATLTTQRPAARSGSSGFSPLVFLAVAFGMAYWFTKTDDFDLITFIRTAIESNLRELATDPRPAPQPGAGLPAQPRSSAPAGSPTEAADPRPTSPTGRASQPALAPSGRAAMPGTARRGSPSEIEGLAPAEVEQLLGPPIRQVVGGDGVNVWVYQNIPGGPTLIVYLHKGRASLKPPR